MVASCGLVLSLWRLSVRAQTSSRGRGPRVGGLYTSSVQWGLSQRLLCVPTCVGEGRGDQVADGST